MSLFFVIFQKGFIFKKAHNFPAPQWEFFENREFIDA